jgi:diguanylate cyclase (GGDEF)-like protein
MESAMETFPEGIALLGDGGHVMFWNRAAEEISGFPSVEVVGRRAPGELEPLLLHGNVEPKGTNGPRLQRGILVHGQHKLGHDLPAILRTLVLRDEMGKQIGEAILFHVADGLDCLPHGEIVDDLGVETTQAKFEERVEAVFQEFTEERIPLGLLWVRVDQAHELRKTHGTMACDAMLERVERTMANGLRPGEELGRWGDDEFLVLAHEATAETLAHHAQVLVGLARTTDFRWWGDRVSLTVSVGAAQAQPGETLEQLLERAQTAMVTSMHAGGNHVMLGLGGLGCSPS